MTFEEITKLSLENEPPSMIHPLGLVWKTAKRDIITDTNNKKYIDFTSTIFVQNFGHSNERVKRYVKKQLDSDLFHTYMFNSEIRTKFIAKLKTYFDSNKKILCLSAGTEATETAIKLMRRNGKNQNPNKKIILSFFGAMHGRTMGAELLKGTATYDEYPDIVPIFNDDIVATLLNKNKKIEDVAGIIIEAYQGWSARRLSQQKLDEIRGLAKEHNFLICFDEVQSGMGRTGKMFCYQLYDNFTPDIICIGKAIGGGFPLSCVIANQEIMDMPKVGEMSSTHSANPICCAAGLAVLEEWDKLKDSSLYKNNIDIFKNAMLYISKEYSNKIVESNYYGMVGALIFKDTKTADKIVFQCLHDGLLLVHTGRESIKLGMPLVIDPKNLKKGFDILIRAINDN